MKESDDVFAENRGSGWNKEALQKCGISDWLLAVEKLRYELAHCARGTYAEFGSTGPDLVAHLKTLRDDLEVVIEQAQDLTAPSTNVNSF